MWVVTIVVLNFLITECHLDDGSPASKDSIFQENFGNQTQLSSLCMKYPGQNVTGLKKKYIFSKSKVNWFRARDLCETFGQEFASITSLSEQQNFIDTYKAGDLETRFIWVGGNDWAIPKNFVWATFPPGPFLYTNWRSGEPNHKDNEHCVYVHTDRWNWNDDECHYTLEFACQTYE